MAQRIKGQETQIVIVRGGTLEDTLTDIQNFNVLFKFERLQVGYLGETTDRYDEIFKGVDFDMELHLHSQNYLDFLGAIQDRARRRVTSTVFNIVVTLFFPSGDTPTLTFPDVKFNGFPINIGSRADYIKIKIEGSCEEFVIQKS